MAKFKVIVSSPEGTSKVVELEDTRAMPLIGRRIGETLDGSIVDLAGKKVQVTGGSDKDGFPMRPSVHGGVRRRILLSGGVGFNPENEGVRKRKTVRGNIITDEIVQVNLKVIEKTEKVKEPKETKKAKKKKEAPEETPAKEPTAKEQKKETPAPSANA